MKSLENDFGGNFKLPANFEKTASTYDPQTTPRQGKAPPPQIIINPQTTLLCEMLGITDPFAVFSGKQIHSNFDPGQNAPDEGHDSPGYDDEGIQDDSDFIDTTMEMSLNTTVNSTFETTANPDEISLDDIDDVDEAEVSQEAEPAAEPVLAHSKFSRLSSNPDEISLDNMDGVVPAASSSAFELTNESMDASIGSISPRSGSSLSPQKRSCEERQLELGEGGSLSSSECRPPLPGPSQPKRFKRRNQSMYNSAENS